VKATHVFYPCIKYVRRSFNTVQSIRTSANLACPYVSTVLRYMCSLLYVSMAELKATIAVLRVLEGKKGES
jgi:hypothetical protein